MDIVCHLNFYHVRRNHFSIQSRGEISRRVPCCFAGGHHDLEQSIVFLNHRRHYSDNKYGVSFWLILWSSKKDIYLQTERRVEQVALGLISLATVVDFSLSKSAKSQPSAKGD